MKYLVTLLLSAALAPSVYADEAVLFSYILEEHADIDDVTTSEFGFLVHFEKSASADLGGTAKLDMRASDEGESVLVDLTLNDYISEEMYVVGKTTVSIPYGSTKTVTWTPPNHGTYKLSVSPSRHNIQ
jgi:hypothetical protein